MPAPRRHSSLFHSCLCTIHRCAELQVSSPACYCQYTQSLPFYVVVVYVYRYKVKLIPGTSRRGKGLIMMCHLHACSVLSVNILPPSLSLCLSLFHFIPIWNLAAKAALHRFLQSKEATQREKDLLKSTKVIQWNPLNVATHHIIPGPWFQLWPY